MSNSAYIYNSISSANALMERDLSSLDINRIGVADIIATYGSYGAYLARIRGSLISLFGDPTISSSELDEAFIYILKASDDKGNTWLLTVFQSSSGIEIGGEYEDISNRESAIELFRLIMNTPPSDFEIELRGIEGIKVVYGCNNGVPYWIE